MRIGGLWLMVFGYTLLYVGWQNINGNTISFVGAIEGETPSSQSSSSLGGGVLGFIGNLVPGLGSIISAGTNVVAAPTALSGGTAPSPTPAAGPSKSGAGALINL